jgi:hypothetical protein
MHHTLRVDGLIRVGTSEATYASTVTRKPKQAQPHEDATGIDGSDP